MCDNGAPVINYDECSSDFTELWRESARSMQEHVRKSGATIVPSKKALIWPGLSLGHFLGSSVPAWSSHARNISEVGFSEVCFCDRHATKLSHVLATHDFFYYTRCQVFGRWVFDRAVQCKSTNIDTAVCADLSKSTAEQNIKAVIPWLGGDYNPWEACDTLQSGSLVNGEYANEAFETSCHPMICPENLGMNAPYYKYHPTDAVYQ